MKTHFNHSLNNKINNNILMHKRKVYASKDTVEAKQEYNKQQIRPAQAISFGGSAALNKIFNSTVEFVYDNEAAYNAIYSLIIAGMLKPLFVLNMPGSEEKDKQIVATKNFLQAFLGSFLSLTIGGGFIKKAIDVVKNNRNLLELDGNNIKAIDAGSTKALEIAKEALKKEKSGFKFKFNTAKEAVKNLSGTEKIKEFYKNYSKAEYVPNIDEIAQKSKDIVKNLELNHLKEFQKNPGFVKQMMTKFGEPTDYSEAFEIFWKNSTGAATGILKAKIASILLPTVMAFLFAKKNLEKQQRIKEATKNSRLNKEKDEFRQMMNKKENNISFKGNILSSAIDGTATIIEKAGMSSFGETATKTVSRFKKPSARMADLESIIITGYWVQNTLRSRKIEPSQKLGLNVHSVLVTIVSSTAAFIIDWALDGLIDKSKENYSKKLKEIVNQIENKNSYRGIGSIIGNSSDAVKMAIEDEVVHLLDSKITPEGLKEITDGEITNILNKLKNMRTLEGFNLDKKTLNDVIVALGNTEPARKEILELSKNMIGSSDIAKQLSRVIGDNEDSINNVIKSLTKQYGKKLSKFKSLTIFTLVVRFLVPVLMVPFSGKLKKKIVEWQEKRAAEKNK